LPSPLRRFDFAHRPELVEEGEGRMRGKYMVRLKGLSKIEKEAIEEVKDRLVKKYKNRLLLLKLYGSKARGDSHPDSDIDILAVVKRDSLKIRDEFFEESYQVMSKHDFRFLICLAVMGKHEFEMYKNGNFSFYRNISREGIDLWSRIKK
jgi:predicted nucleotidyltransferase